MWGVVFAAAQFHLFFVLLRYTLTVVYINVSKLLHTLAFVGHQCSLLR
jgi:hypothetical protein